MFWHNAYIWDEQHKCFSQDERILMFASGINLNKKQRLGMSAPMNEDTFPHEKKNVWELKGDILNIPNLNSHFVSWES
jgi:hypothetical protein